MVSDSNIQRKRKQSGKGTETTYSDNQGNSIPTDIALTQKNKTWNKQSGGLEFERNGVSTLTSIGAKRVGYNPTTEEIIADYNMRFNNSNVEYPKNMITIGSKRFMEFDPNSLEQQKVMAQQVGNPIQQVSQVPGNQIQQVSQDPNKPMQQIPVQNMGESGSVDLGQTTRVGILSNIVKALPYISGIIANLKEQSQENITTEFSNLGTSSKNIRAIITDTNQGGDPSENMQLFNNQLAIIDDSYSKLYLECRTNLNKWLGKDGSVELEKFANFYSPGGMRDILVTNMQQAILNPNPSKSLINLSDLENTQ